MINKIVKKFKDNVIWLFLIELFCFTFTFLIGFFGYKEIQSRLSVVGNFSPKLNEIAARLQGQDLAASDVLELSNQLTSVETNVQILRLLIILLPLGLFLAYSFFQGLSWYIISRDKLDIKKILDRKYLLSFFGISLIYFVILYLFWYLLFKALPLNTFFPAIAIITLVFVYFWFVAPILAYFLFVTYVVSYEYKGVFSSLKNGISMGFNNVARLMPVFSVFYLVFFIILPAVIFLTPLFTNTNIVIYIILGILLVLIWILFKIALTERAKKLI